MPMVALRPCPSCARHARVTEPACPFCGAWLGEAFRTFAAPRAPTARLSRAALFAIGAAGFTGVQACGSVANLYGGVPCEGSECVIPVITADASGDARAPETPIGPAAAPEAGSALD